MTFAALVKSRITGKKISLRELCRRSGMDPSLLSKALAGKRNPPSDDNTLARLARALDVSPAELFVSAGKIPRQWRRILGNRELFENVRLVMERSPAGGEGEHPRRAIKADKTPAFPARKVGPERYKRQSLAEELL